MVQTNQYAPQAGGNVSTYDQEDPFALIAGGKGGKSISFNLKDAYGNNQSLPLGTSFTGVLCENIKVTPVLKYGTTEPDVYPDGNPKKQIRSILQNVLVSLPGVAGAQWQDIRTLNTEADEEDEGKRALYFKNQMKQALDDAMKVAGVPNFGIGTRITVRLIDMKKADNPNYNAQKLYEVTLSEIQPYIPEATIQATNELQGALQQGAPQQQVAPTPPPLQTATPAQFPTQAEQYAAAQPQQQFALPPQGAQFVQPQQPTFPGQVVPAQPQVPQGIDFAALAAQRDAQQAAAQQVAGGVVAGNIPPQLAPQVAQQFPQQGVAQPGPAIPPQGAPVVTQEMVQQVELVIRQGVDHATAVDGVANMFAPGNDAFRKALSESVPF